MSSFVPRLDTLRVTFPEGSEWYGAVVRCRRYASVAFMLELETAIKATGQDVQEESEPVIYPIIRRFTETTLVGWNLRMPVVDPEQPEIVDVDGIPEPNYLHDGDGDLVTEAVPSTVEGMMSLPQSFVLDLLIAYQEAKTGVNPKSLTQQQNGEQSEAPPETTEASSPSRTRSRRRTS
jgi:hypothetical protein